MEPMNPDSPITYPRLSLAEAPPVAQIRAEFLSHLYARSLPPDTEGVDWLIEHGYALIDREGKAVARRKVHPTYVTAAGRGTTVGFVTVKGSDDYTDLLLATVIGGDVEPRDGGKVTYRARHVTATDEEHDAASTFLIELDSATFHPGMYGRWDVTGWATKVHMYGTSADPEDRSRLCEHDGCDRHGFAPFLPPEVEDPRVLHLPRKVKVETFPIRHYLLAD